MGGGGGGIEGTDRGGQHDDSGDRCILYIF